MCATPIEADLGAAKRLERKVDRERFVSRKS
jgi:hypothetical protein